MDGLLALGALPTTEELSGAKQRLYQVAGIIDTREAFLDALHEKWRPMFDDEVKEQRRKALREKAPTNSSVETSNTR